ncbi:hypothetical protein HK405_006952 [Cladochytrium tenue]|nr:hypothetical protein HK405_006952 [Cladochytrium tenue]
MHLARAKYSVTPRDDAQMPFLMASAAAASKSRPASKAASDSSVSSTSQVLANEQDLMWSCNVTLNGQEYPVDLDTGSADTWFISSYCTGDSSCTNGYPTIDVTDLVSSSSYTFMNKTWYTTYGTGGVAGPLFSGPISIGDYTANVTFGLGFIVLQMDGASGLMGLGFESLSNINEFNQLFGFYLSNSADGDAGEVTFGGADDTRYTGDITWVPLSSETYWQYDISGWTWSVASAQASGSIGSNSTGSAAPQAISDTGTTLLMVSNDAADGINTAIGGTYNQTLGAYAVDCTGTTSLPDVVFTTSDGVELSIKASTYVFPNGDGTCFSGIVGGGDDLQIWGDVFTRNYYTIYDKANARVGFAESVHTTTSSSSASASKPGSFAQAEKSTKKKAPKGLWAHLVDA